MAEYVLTTCSTADRPREFFETRNIPFICFKFTMDGVTYPDDLGKSFPIDEFYRRIAAGAMPTTSQINATEYTAFWEPFLKEGKDILHMTLSSGITGSINSANAAAAVLRETYPDRRIEVVDSLAASAGFGLFVELVADKRDEGASIDELLAYIDKIRLHVHHWFFSTDLTSYWRGGRISKTKGIIGNMLNICPLMNVNNEGKLIPRRNVRTKKKVMVEQVKEMEQHAEGGLNYSGKVRISNSGCLEDAKKVKALIEEKFPNIDGEVEISNIGTVIGAHTGPGTVALFFVGDLRTQ